MGGVVMIVEPDGYGFRSLFTSPLLDGFGQVTPPCSLPQFTLPEDGKIRVSTSGGLGRFTG